MTFEFIEDENLRNQVIEEHENVVNTINAGIQEKIDSEVSGLKENRDQLLSEVKEAKKNLKSYEALGELEKVKESLQWLKDNEDAQLIKDGKIDEVVHRRTQEMREAHEEVVNEFQKKVDNLSSVSEQYKIKYETKMVEDELTKEALKAGVLPGAIPDVLLHGREIFSLGENGEVEARDAEGKLVKTKDGDLILTPSNWIAGLKTTSSHYWPPSEGAGASGASGSGGDNDLQSRIDAAAASGNMKLFKELREKQLKSRK